MDERGKLFYNNDFNAVGVKRVYFIENAELDFKRGWQGHKIEQRWFSVVQGRFKIQVIKIDNWDKPASNHNIQEFILDAESLDILHVPKGYITSLQSLDKSARLMAMSDYRLGEIEDEQRFEQTYFKQK